MNGIARSSDDLNLARVDRWARALAPWFLQHQRDLEWRQTRDPYAIWVSEVMLQQTRVETVRAYWTPFLRRFPDVAALAEADVEDVLGAWSGLGYYRRARLLHRGAQHVQAHLGGQLPGDPKLLREIPGIGRYTAGAIASIAYDQPAALVDGNVARVLSRLQAITDPTQQGAEARGHWDVAQKIVEAGSPRVLAQALMELGATVCTPQQPRCSECPLQRECAARAQDVVAQIPAPRVRAVSPHEDLWALALRQSGRLLLLRRPAQGLLAGMWCLPLLPRSAAVRPRLTTAAVQRQLGVAVTGLRPVGASLRHIFTHRVWNLWPCDGELAPSRALAGDVAWINVGERPAGGIPTVTEKLLERLGY